MFSGISSRRFVAGFVGSSGFGVGFGRGLLDDFLVWLGFGKSACEGWL